MKKYNTKRYSNKKTIGIVLVLIAFLLVVILCLHSSRVDTKDGIAYIKNLEKSDTKQVKNLVMEKRVAERKEAIKDGEMNVFSLFEDYMFFGDSRVMGFENYGFLDANRVASDSGATIKYVDNHLEEVKALQPSTVILSYGVNDMGLDLDSEEGGYGGLYEREVNKILKIVPDAKIYVVSIIPCTPQALEKSPRWAHADDYNSQLKSICKKNKWTYIDATGLADGGNADIYQADGIHFTREFYEDWANVITDAILRNEE